MPHRKGRAAVHWRRDVVILARLEEVERRHVAGATNCAIANALGCDERSIRRDLARVQELWRERVGVGADALRAQRVAKLEGVRHLALEAVNAGKVGTAGSSAQHLDLARKTLMDEARILGLLVEKIAPTTDKGETLPAAMLAWAIRKKREREEASSSAGGSDEADPGDEP